MWSAEQRLGPVKMSGAYAWRTVLDDGGIVANGTDAPVELLNPYQGLFAAVTRQWKEADREFAAANPKAPWYGPGSASPTGGGTPGGSSGWYTEQCLNRAEALRAYTIWSAYAEFAEDIKGTLEIGKLADFAVIDRDYFDVKACPNNDIEFIEVLMTVLGGEVVYENPAKSGNNGYSLLTHTAAPGTIEIAQKSNNTLIFNGKAIVFPAVKLQAYNWLKLRDLASILNGASKQFSLDYDDSTKTISITTGKVYSPIGDELSDNLNDNINAVVSQQHILLNGKAVEVAAYNIDGYNYLRLRDMAIMLDFGVDYDETTGNITLNLDEPYVE
jgi:hypothetical protein